MMRRASCGLSTTSIPPTNARPESGRSRVARIRTHVVLPAPLGPSKTQHRALGNGQVEPIQCGHFLVGLDETFDFDRDTHYGASALFTVTRPGKVPVLMVAY